MLNVSITVTGLDRFVDDLKSFPQNAPKMLDSAIQRSADQLAKDTQNMPPVNVATSGYGTPGIPVAPVYGGTMRQMIHSQNLGLLAAGVIADTSYSGYVAYGTWKMQARDFFRWALELFGGLKHIEEIVQNALDKLFTA